MAVGFGIVGFMDDYISIKKHRNLGLTEIQKLVFAVHHCRRRTCVSVSMAGGTTETVMPFIGTVDLGVFYYFSRRCLSSAWSTRSTSPTASTA